MENYAYKLLRKLDGKHLQLLSKPVRESTRVCLLGFQNYLNIIAFESVKKDNSGNDPYVIGAIFKDNKSIRPGVEAENFARISLTLACRKFNDLVREIKRFDPDLKHKSIARFGDLIKEFIMDLKPIVEHFERKLNPAFFLVKGWKSYNNSSFEIFSISNALYWSGFHQGNIFDQKMATNISIFALRQALEVKFKRICGIYSIYNSTFNGPRLRHDFFPEFISKNLNLFRLPDLNLKDLIKVYKWTNLTIHNAENPRIWELHFALDYVEPLFRWGESITSSGSLVKSANGAIMITDYEELKKQLLIALSQGSSEMFCIEFINPEAMT